MIRRNSVSLVLIFLIFNVILTYGQNISGRLLNKNTKQPIPAVPLSLSNIDLIIYTNATGSFTFRDIKAGKYTIFANINNSLIPIKEFDFSGKDLALGDIEAEAGLTSVSEEISVIDVTDLASMENENDNFSSALSAGRDPFVNATAFNLSSGRFRPRGYFNEDSDMWMNGMLMNYQDDGRVLGTAGN